MSKFNTTSSKLYNNNNINNIPSWMDELSKNMDMKEKKQLNIEFDKKGAFANTNIVTRPNITASPRDLEESANPVKMEINAKTELAKFLLSKYYKTNTRIAGNNVYLDTNIDGIQANFTFGYEYNNNKMIHNATFLANDSEYPFSTEGFNECMQDIKNGTLKKSIKKVASSRETYVINREEIIRRYNGSLRKATDTINAYIKEGVIVGAGSNAYASFYNPDELFPQEKKEMPKQISGSFDYVNNKEHVATNEHKSAKNLSLEASKILSNLFPDYAIKNVYRDNNELLVKATVLNNNDIRNEVNFNFEIDNEKIKSLRLAEINDQRMSIENLLEKLNINNNISKQYLKSSIASKRIYNGYILTELDISNKLHTLVSKNNISKVITAWKNMNLINQINSTTYSTKYSFPELLNNIYVETLSNDEQTKIAEYKKKFGAGLEFDRYDVQDTGNRDMESIDNSKEMQLYHINNAISKYFKKYQIISYNNNIVTAQFINNGVKNNIRLKPYFNGRRLHKLNAIVNNKEIDLSKLSSAFNNSPLLNIYLQNNQNKNNFSNSIIASDSNLLKRLSVLTPDAENVLATWKQKYLKNIGGNLYSSQYSFEELLNNTVANTLSKNDIDQIIAAKQYFGNSLNRITEKDTGIREADSKISNETLLYEADKILSKHFANYTPKYFENTANNDMAKYKISLFDENTGLSTDLDFLFWYEGNRPVLCKAIVGKEELDINNVKKAFATNDILNKYLQTASGKKFNAPMIMTKSDMIRKLSKITNASDNEISDVISNWSKFGKINQLNSNTFASKLSFEQLISMSNIKPLSDQEIADKLNKSQRNKNMKLTANYINDNDTRELNETWSPEKMALHARAIIGNMFADFDIIDAEINNDNYSIIARIVNPLNGLKQSLKFNFSTVNGTKLGDLKDISDGSSTVKESNIINLLKTNNKAVNKFITLNNINTKSYKNVISNSNLKSKLLLLADMNDYDLIKNSLIKNNILKQVDNFNYASEYSMPEIVQYLSDNNLINMKKAEIDLRTNNKDAVVNTNVKHIIETDNRTLNKKEEKLSPKMIQTSSKLNKLIISSFDNKKITLNKKNLFLNSLSKAKNENDIENVWRELKKFL